MTRGEKEVLNTSGTGQLGGDGKAANQCSYCPAHRPTAPPKLREAERTRGVLEPDIAQW